MSDTTTLSPSFLAGILLKVSFCPDTMKRHQGALLLTALTNQPFTADEVLGHLTKDDGSPDNTTAGCCVGSLASMGLILQVGRVKSTSASRNGSKVSLWAINPDKRATVLTWLKRHGFEAVSLQGELALAAN